MKFLITLTLTVSSAILLGQENESFCGYVKYEIKYYKGKKDKTHKAKGIKSETKYFCNNNFKVLQDGTLQDIYIGDSNKYYTFYSVQEDSIINMVNADQFYGEKPPKYLPVDKFIYDGKEYSRLINKKSKITYLFNDSIKIDLDKFNNCNVHHWSTFYNHTNGRIPLIIINKTGWSRIIYKVIEVKEIELTPSFFSLPEGCEVIDYTDDFRILNW